MFQATFIFTQVSALRIVSAIIILTDASWMRSLSVFTSVTTVRTPQSISVSNKDTTTGELTIKTEYCRSVHPAGSCSSV